MSAEREQEAFQRAWAADCIRCWQALSKEIESFALKAMSRRMIGCSVCRNKRCPKATDHNLTCTGSNQRGQPGSDYQ